MDPATPCGQQHPLLHVLQHLLLAQSPVTFDNSETLFAVLTAINNCGFDAELASSDPLRLAIRAEVGHNIESSEPAKAAADSLCAFYHDHQQRDDTRTLSQYLSLALYLTPPPDLAPKVKESDLPPDASGVLGLVPLLGKFYTEAGIHSIWERHSAAYAELANRYRDALSKMVFDDLIANRKAETCTFADFFRREERLENTSAVGFFDAASGVMDRYADPVARFLIARRDVEIAA